MSRFSTNSLNSITDKLSGNKHIMLRYYICRQQLPTIQTQHATPFKMHSAESFAGKVIPFTHIYVTSDPYSRRIKKQLSKNELPHFEEVNNAKKRAIENHQRYPVDFKAHEFKSVSEMRTWVDKNTGGKKTINIVVVNGIGTGFGDNIVGLGALQRLSNLLAPNTVNFYLMQTMNARANPIFMRSKNIIVKNNCMPMNGFLKMDLMINLTGMLGFPEFNELPLAQFKTKMFSISHLAPKTSLHAKLHLSTNKSKAISYYLEQFFDNERPIILIHPQASSPLRTMPDTKALSISKQLIKSGFNVVCALEDKITLDDPYFTCISKFSKSIDDLKHVISACDGVISVGTVVYHISAALSKPTLLLPTVKADIESANITPEVKTWLPKKSAELITNLHKSREEDDLKTANKIWNNINAKNLVADFQKHIDSFNTNGQLERNNLKAANAPTLVGVVIPHFGDQEKLNRCLDSLIKVEGFDPAHLYVIDNNEKNRYFTVAVNKGINLALNEGCEYVWVLNNDTKVHPGYLTATLNRFSKNKKIGIVGGKNLKTEKPDRIFWGGSYNAFPTGQHKAGYVSRNDLILATRETWATFSSVVIKAQTYKDVGGLDNSMRMIFSDSDFCFSAQQHGWETWYEPEAVVMHDTGVSARGANNILKQIFREDKKSFYKKWRKITNCDDPEKLQDAILNEIGFT